MRPPSVVGVEGSYFRTLPICFLFKLVQQLNCSTENEWDVLGQGRFCVTKLVSYTKPYLPTYIRKVCVYCGVRIMIGTLTASEAEEVAEGCGFEYETNICVMSY